MSKLAVLEFPMLHTKFQQQRPIGSEKNIFKVFLPYLGMTGVLVIWPGSFEHTFVTPSQVCSMWDLTLIGPIVSEEKMFEECGRRTTEACISYKLTDEPSVGWANKMSQDLVLLQNEAQVDSYWELQTRYCCKTSVVSQRTSTIQAKILPKSPRDLKSNFQMMRRVLKLV